MKVKVMGTHPPPGRLFTMNCGGFCAAMRTETGAPETVTVKSL
jgi:hypothetical protein